MSEKRGASGMVLDRDLAHAAAWDEGNASMRKAGRKKWSRADYNAAARTFSTLYPRERALADARKEAAERGDPSEWGRCFFCHEFVRIADAHEHRCSA